jgi:hypothetical protein
MIKMISETDIKDKSNVDITYPSAKVLLDMIKIEYDNEFQRASALDSKVSITLTLSAALLALIYPLTNLKAVLDRSIVKVSECIIPLICILSVAISFGFLVVAIFHFIEVISLHKYKAIDPKCFTDVEYFSKPENEMAIVISFKYKDAIEENRIVNEARMLKYQKAVTFVVISIIFLIVSYIIKYNFI